MLRTLALIEVREHNRGLRADLFQLDDAQGERPAAAAGPCSRKAGKPTNAKAKPAKDGRCRTAPSMRASPPLVSRRQP